MQIISGIFKNKKILQPGRGVVGFHPMGQRLRSILFDTLMSNFAPTRQWLFLDAACGTGSVGLELISRGFEGVHFLDVDKQKLVNVSNLLTNWGVDHSKKICYNTLYAKDLHKICFINANLQNIFLLPVKYHCLILDLPYQMDNIQLNTVINNLYSKNWIDEKGLLIVSHYKKYHIENCRATLFKQKIAADGTLSFFIN